MSLDPDTFLVAVEVVGRKQLFYGGSDDGLVGGVSKATDGIGALTRASAIGSSRAQNTACTLSLLPSPRASPSSHLPNRCRRPSS